MTDKRLDIDIDIDRSNNNNLLSNGTKNRITMHGYSTGKEIVNIISLRGGLNGLLPKGTIRLIQYLSISKLFAIKQFPPSLRQFRKILNI